ncbi:MAG: hypothetical protein LW850_11310 [Planctomycetaceae bacterium]|nr:hypothetical protein [Planctomycetaceae bacterium]
MRALFHSRNRFARPILCLLGILGLVGCRPEPAATTSDLSGAKKSDTPAEKQSEVAAATGNQDARTLLAECLKTYRNLERYQDSAQLVIQGTSTLTLPMQVAWEKPNRLGLRTGSMRGSWTSTTWEAQSLGAVNPFPNQRLVRVLPPTIDLGWVTDDSMGGLLLDPMSKPIQIELLLSNDLSDSLVGSDSKLTVLEPASFDDVECQRVIVEKTIASQNLRWVLWIDSKSKLLKQVELPAQFYYPNVPSEQLADIRCSMQMLKATKDEPIDWSSWLPPSIAQEVHVSRWVAPPPIALDFKDSNDALVLDTAEPKKPWNVLVWISDRSESKPLIDDLIHTQRILLEKELTPSCNIFLVCSAEDAKGLAEKLRSWNCEIPLSVDRNGTLTKSFQISQAPAMIVLDRSRRVQVGEFIVTPQTIASIPELIGKLRAQQDLASRQLQQDLDNQARFIGALHRVAIDKDQITKLPEINEFPFAMYGMRRDWKVDFEAPLVSASGVWYPEASLDASTQSTPSQIAMVTLDEDGRLQSIAFDGTKKFFSKIETEQADGAKRLVTTIDPWSRKWIAVIPEGLPRFWIAPLDSPNNAPGLATAYNTQAAESPVCHAWIPQANDGNLLRGSKLAVGTSQSRLMMIDPSSEQRFDATFREPPVGFVPGLASDGKLSQWDVLYGDGTLHKISNLSQHGIEASLGGTIEARLEQLAQKPIGGNWFWGNHTPARAQTTQGSLAEIYLGKLPSGETGIITSNHLHQPLANRALTVRAEQSRLWGSARLKDGTLMGLASGPSKILHLFSADYRLFDQASFGTKVFGAALIGWQEDLKIVVALEKEVSCWSIDVPNMLPNAGSV